MIKCIACAKKCGIGDDFVTLNPCGHRICPQCMCKSLATRGCELLKCPKKNCRKVATSHTYNEFVENSTRCVQSEPVRHACNDKWKDPIRFYSSLTKENRKGKAVIAVALEAEGDDGKNGEDSTDNYYDGRIRAMTCIVPLNGKSISAANEENLVQLFCFLHPIVMSSVTDHPLPCLSPREYIEFAMGDTRLISRCMYALGSRSNSWDEALMQNPYWQSQLLSCVSAGELLSRCCRRKPGYLQLLMSDQLSLESGQLAL